MKIYFLIIIQIATKKSKFKVGDPVVFSFEEKNVYMLIYNMSYQQKMWIYNILVNGAFYPESSLRLATDEEIKLYFSNLKLWK